MNIAIISADPSAKPDATVLIVAGGWLFWKLVGVLARIQMPERPSRSVQNR